MNSPPHLPPKACNLRAHHAFKSVWWLLFLIFVTGLASVALTLSTLVWFAPSFIPDQMYINTKKITTIEEAVFDLLVLNNIKKRLWDVYDIRDKVVDQFYSDLAEKYQATMFSSDGWAVTYAPDYRKGDEKFWEGVDYQGTNYNIEKVFVDPVSKLIYIKFEGDGFPFVSFANWENINSNDVVWEVSQSEYRQHMIVKDLSVVKVEYKIWQPQLLYLVKDNFDNGNVVVNDAGELVGILDEEGRIIYGWLVDSQFASILQNGAPNYKAVPWTGYMVNGFVAYGDLIKKVSGFYVKNSDTKVTSSTVGVGDVITKIQNQSVNILDLSRQMLLSPTEFFVTIYRDGQEFDIPLKKNKVLIK